MVCTCGVVYMLCMWCCVHLALCTHCSSGVMYKWCCVHIVQVMSCTCDFVYTLCRWCYVYVVLCTCCTCGTGVHVILCAYHTCCVSVYVVLCMWIVFSWYHDMCIHCVVLCVCICVVLYIECRSMHYAVLYTGWRCMCGMLSVGVGIAWCCMPCMVLCVWCTLCVCAPSWGESIGCLSSVAINLDYVQNKENGRR